MPKSGKKYGGVLFVVRYFRASLIVLPGYHNVFQLPYIILLELPKAADRVYLGTPYGSLSIQRLE